MASTATSDILKSPTGYFAVYLSANNVVLFGKIENPDGEFLKLTDVHYIRSNIDSQKKEVNNQLVRRSGEWHQPQETLIARERILLIEPVAEGSRVMIMIQQMRPKGQ